MRERIGVLPCTFAERSEYGCADRQTDFERRMGGRKLHKRKRGESGEKVKRWCSKIVFTAKLKAEWDFPPNALSLFI